MPLSTDVSDALEQGCSNGQSGMGEDFKLVQTSLRSQTDMWEIFWYYWYLLPDLTGLPGGSCSSLPQSPAVEMTCGTFSGTSPQ